MKREVIKDVLKLCKDKRYDEIYSKYGRSVYVNVVPFMYQYKDIKKLLKDGEFLDIYEKYGSDTYNKKLKKIQKLDVMNEIGAHPGFINFLFFEKCKKSLKILKSGLITTGFATASLSLAVAGLVSNDINENEAIYEEELDDYNNEIKQYAEYINSLGLNDLEIVLKVMNDMWTNIEGYKSPDGYDDIGYNRLSLYMNGYGVCRNMADDFTARMNAINPEYEACNLNVYIDDADINNIERNIIEENNTVDDDAELSEPNLFDKAISDVLGNHMVSCIKLKEHNVLLIVDPTNPSIGVLKNGKIYMLSDAKDAIDTKSLGSSFFGIDGLTKYMGKIAESYTTNGDYNSLNEKYGKDVQNQILVDLIEDYDEEHYHVK